MRASTLRRLERFNRGIEMLEELGKANKKQFIRDLRLISIAERNLQVCIEFLIDLSNFILSELGCEIPSSYKQAVLEMGKIGATSKNEARKLGELVGIRNILVHAYADIKADLLYSNLPTFIRALRKGVNDLLKFCEQKGLDP